jgi:hypothetical protein
MKIGDYMFNKIIKKYVSLLFPEKSPRYLKWAQWRIWLPILSCQFISLIIWLLIVRLCMFLIVSGQFLPGIPLLLFILAVISYIAKVDIYE